MSENIPTEKRGRGRPKKVVSKMTEAISPVVINEDLKLKRKELRKQQMNEYLEKRQKELNKNKID